MKRWSALLFSLHSRTVPWVCSRHISTVKKAHDKIHVVIRTIARYGYLVRSVAMQPLLTERSKQASKQASRRTSPNRIPQCRSLGGGWVGSGVLDPACVRVSRINRFIVLTFFFPRVSTMRMGFGLRVCARERKGVSVWRMEATSDRGRGGARRIEQR